MQEQVLDHEEIEWQLEAVELAPVENWLNEHPSAAGVDIVPGWARELSDVYYDTEDWRLYRAAYALRVRNTDGQSAEATMKALAPAEGGLRRRREISEPIEGIETLRGSPGRSVNASEDSRAPQICARSSRFAPEGAPTRCVPKYPPQGRSRRTLRATSAGRSRRKMPSSSPRSHSTSRISSLTVGRGPT